jgi:hypothetical protein
MSFRQNATASGVPGRDPLSVRWVGGVERINGLLDSRIDGLVGGRIVSFADGVLERSVIRYPSRPLILRSFPLERCALRSVIRYPLSVFAGWQRLIRQVDKSDP